MRIILSEKHAMEIAPTAEQLVALTNALADQLQGLLSDEDLTAQKLEEASETILPRIHDHLRLIARLASPPTLIADSGKRAKR